MRRFEYRDDKSAKFWSVAVSGATMTVSYGRIGSDGQTKRKDFDDEAKANAEAEKLIDLLLVLLNSSDVGFFVARPAVEVAEFAIGNANVGGIGVPVDDPGDNVTRDMELT